MKCSENSGRKIVLALGSNRHRGKTTPNAFIHRALTALSPNPHRFPVTPGPPSGLITCGHTPIIQTAPLLVTNQPNFLNCLVWGHWSPPQNTDLETGLFHLLEQIQRLEGALGRRESVPKGPREIDIDILGMENLWFQTERLRLPHPGLFDRAFLWELIQELPAGWQRPGVVGL